MTLRDLDGAFEHNYSTGRDNVVESLYRPCLANSITYYRGVGFFNSSIFSLMTKDLVTFALNGGKMHLLTSPPGISPDDYEAAIKGYSLRDFENNLEDMLRETNLRKPTELLCALIANKQLEIHIAMIPPPGMYHDKVGFFEDSNGDVVSFSGSGNETNAALSGRGGNIERYTVGWSWSPEYQHYGGVWESELRETIQKRNLDGARILNITEIDPSIIERNEINLDLGHYIDIFSTPGSFHDRPLFDYGPIHEDGPAKHQTDAINLWIDNGHRGIFQHATGTYKTASGLMAADEMFSQGAKGVVITAPMKPIAHQWLKLVRDCFDQSKITTVMCWSDKDPTIKGEVEWVDQCIGALDQGKKLIAIYVNKSLYKSEGTPTVLRAISSNWGLIVDEAHHWDKSEAQPFINTYKPNYRLGLSAELEDPERPGSASLLIDYLSKGKSENPLIDNLPLSTAIEMEFLRKYDYTIKPIKIQPNFNIGNSDRDVANDIWKRFQDEKRKEAINDTIEMLETQHRVLAYTGPAVQHCTDLQRDIRIEWDSKTGKINLPKKFTSHESQNDRTKIIDDFNSGLTRVLVAIKCLDEGVNIPVADGAIMAISNEDHRQWIQRRGRILRKNPTSENDSTAAHIVDYILDISELGNLVDYLPKVSSDIRRVREFADTSTLESKSKIDKVIGMWGV